MTTPAPTQIPNPKPRSSQPVVTIILRNSDNPWSVTHMLDPDTGGPVLLMQDASLNFGIVGTRKQIVDMLSRIHEALLDQDNVIKLFEMPEETNRG